MPFIALQDRDFICPVESDEPTGGGIIIPDSAEGKPQDGGIVSVGTRTNRADGARITVEHGGRIHFGKCSGSELRSESADPPVMKESGILGEIA